LQEHHDRHAGKMKIVATETLDVITGELGCNLNEENKTALLKFFQNEGSEEAARSIHQLTTEYKKNKSAPQITATLTGTVSKTPDPVVLDNVSKMVTTNDALIQNGVSASANISSNSLAPEWTKTVSKWMEPGLSAPPMSRDEMARLIKEAKSIGPQ